MQAARHTFHIPVMGLAYTIDTPAKVARFGINSVISIVEDNLIEKMRSHYYPLIGEAYLPIDRTEPDARARRITDYLNVLDRIIQRQVEAMRVEPFGEGSRISQYFEMLPEENPLKQLYQRMNATDQPAERKLLDGLLRKQIVPGSIDVNIMTKVDKLNKDQNGVVIEDGSDAVAAMRGYVYSNLTNSSVILSAGMNPRLFAYMEKLNDFDASPDGTFRKKIVIKVSDFRSALIQGKMLAKKGIWTSEFRIESGLNCGGHAFASDGYLLGPILEEFKSRRAELEKSLLDIYTTALREKGKPALPKAPAIRITVQGGIGTSEEDTFLRNHYAVDGTGWGTPFLLVPEATTVDEPTLKRLQESGEKDVVLSHNSPLGVPFYYLKGTTAETEKYSRILKGKPGSPCLEKFLALNTEFGEESICTASHTYQKKKIEELKARNLPEDDYERELQKILDKECLCVGLSNAAVNQYRLTPFQNLKAVNICPGPNIAYFSEIVSLRKMIDHIYGRTNIIRHPRRPHMFIKELKLYVDYWSDLLADTKAAIDAKQKTYLHQFHDNLVAGIDYYRSLADEIGNGTAIIKEKFETDLADAEEHLNGLLEKFLGTPVLAH